MLAILRCAVCASFLVTLSTLPAAALDKPAGEPILTITGAVANANAGDAAQFDAAMLEALEGRKATLETPWTTGATEFSGPYLRAVLEAAGAKGKTLRVKALNDYAADVPLEDAQDFDTILAVRMNGEAMSVRDKGPLFLIYPFDKNPELFNEKYFARSVWQIREIEVLD